MIRLILLMLLILANSAAAVDHYTYRVLEKRPHSRSAWVQGLEIRDGELFQGTGKKGRSRLQVFDFSTGELLREKRLPRKYFGEGITVMNDRVYQLTWHAKRGFIYRRDDLGLLGEFSLQGQGWGLTHDGKRLILSDGSAVLQFLSPEDGRVLGKLPVTEEGKPVTRLNELEWTPDYLLANIWYSDDIIMIDPNDGTVTGRIDLRGLLPKADRRQGTSVLNGIARDAETGDLWVTGKNWPWIYRIELLRQTGLE